MKDENEIQKMADQASDAARNPKFKGQTYEDGVLAALDWVLGNIEESPLE